MAEQGRMLPANDGPEKTKAPAPQGIRGSGKRELQPAARFCRISNAGKVLPSSTSRKAPPPVEM